jgi:hypothetical protein
VEREVFHWRSRITGYHRRKSRNWSDQQPCIVSVGLMPHIATASSQIEFVEFVLEF